MTHDTTCQHIVLESIVFGLPHSEAERGGHGELAPTSGLVRHQFGGPPHVRPDLQGVRSWRESARLLGFEFRPHHGPTPPGLCVELCLRRYAHNAPPGPPAAVRVVASLPERMIPCGTINVDPTGRWQTFTVDLSAALPPHLEAGTLVIVLDDRANTTHPHHHYGLSIHSARLMCAPDAAVPPERPLASRWHPPVGGEVVLVMCPVWDPYVAPLSIACLASYLRQAGVGVSVMDLSIEGYHAADPEQRRMWGSGNIGLWSQPEFLARAREHFRPLFDEAVERILTARVPNVAFSVNASNLAMTVEMARRIKAASPGVRVLFGGPGMPLMNAHQLGNDWDYVVVGEGEEALLHLLHAPDEPRVGVVPAGAPDIDRLLGERHVAPDLNQLPLLSFEGFDLNLYRHIERVPAYTSRGCTRRCTYCFDTEFYAPYRTLAAERAVEHLVGIWERHGRANFDLTDLLINGRLKVMRPLMRGLVDSGIPLTWGAFATIRADMTDDDFALLRAAGCEYLRFGFETACADHLRTIRRGYKKDAARHVLAASRRAGIRTTINLMVGFPGETDETVEETARFIEENRDSIDRIDSINTLSVMPGTEIHRRRGELGIVIDDATGEWRGPDHDHQRRLDWQARLVTVAEGLGLHDSTLDR